MIRKNLRGSHATRHLAFCALLGVAEACGSSSYSREFLASNSSSDGGRLDAGSTGGVTLPADGAFASSGGAGGMVAVVVEADGSAGTLGSGGYANPAPASGGGTNGGSGSGGGGPGAGGAWPQAGGSTGSNRSGGAAGSSTGTPRTGGAAGTGGSGPGGARPGGSPGTAGTSSGGMPGTGGAVGTGGTLGSGGAAFGTGGAAVTGGQSGTGGSGSGGSGGAAGTADTAIYSFESSQQSWSMAAGGATFSNVARSTAQHFAGEASLAGTVSAVSGKRYILEVAPPSPAIPAQAIVTFHVHVPSSAELTAIQPYLIHSGSVFVGSYTRAANLNLGAWTTIVVTVPDNVGTVNKLGVQFDSSGSWSGTVYLDSIDW